MKITDEDGPTGRSTWQYASGVAMLAANQPDLCPLDILEANCKLYARIKALRTVGRCLKRPGRGRETLANGMACSGRHRVSSAVIPRRREAASFAAGLIPAVVIKTCLRSRYGVLGVHFRDGASGNLSRRRQFHSPPQIARGHDGAEAIVGRVAAQADDALAGIPAGRRVPAVAGHFRDRGQRWAPSGGLRA